MAKRHLTASEIIKADGYFKQYLKPVPNSDLWEYEDNWSDEKIAGVLSPEINKNAIGGLRLKLYGKLDSRADVVGNIKVKELETIVSNILVCFGELESKYNKLVDTLALNKVANVAHLKTTVKEKKE